MKGFLCFAVALAALTGLTGIDFQARIDAVAAPVPEHPGAYPESNMFRPNRILPAYGLYVRHADGVVLDDVTFTLPSGAEDTRAEIVKDDAEVRMIRE